MSTEHKTPQTRWFDIATTTAMACIFFVVVTAVGGEPLSWASALAIFFALAGCVFQSIFLSLTLLPAERPAAIAAADSSSRGVEQRRRD